MGMRAAFERILGKCLVVPPDFEVMGAMGAALSARDTLSSTGHSKFKGFEIGDLAYKMNSFQCEGCSNECEVVEVKAPMEFDQERVVRWGGRCGKWESV